MHCPMRIVLSLADLGIALTRTRKSITLTSWMRRLTMRRPMMRRALRFV
jgi:hypothetical protein